MTRRGGWPHMTRRAYDFKKILSFNIAENGYNKILVKNKNSVVGDLTGHVAQRNIVKGVANG